jgi:DNA-binding transcriptional MerR regulator
MSTKMRMNDELDVEWVKLILEALEMGINKEEIRSFFQENKLK